MKMKTEDWENFGKNGGWIDRSTAAWFNWGHCGLALSIGILLFPPQISSCLLVQRLVSSFCQSHFGLGCCAVRGLSLFLKVWTQGTILAPKSGDFKLKVSLRVQLFGEERNLNEKFKATKKMSCVTAKYHNINRIPKIKMHACKHGHGSTSKLQSDT